VNLFVTALQAPFTVSMWPTGSGAVAPSELTAALAPGKTTQLQATVPSGTAPGEYDIAVHDQSGCSAVMERALVVTDNLSIDAGVVSPPFARETASQALTVVLGSASSATGTPRAFLNPPGDEPAVQLASVTRIDATTLTAIAPAGTPVGVYDAGIGPRMYFLESVVRGDAGGEPFQDTAERSMKFGFGVPLGAEYELGPGGIFAEFLLQWAPVDHTTTGDTHLGGSSLYLGYRVAI
jgi:hypothetical protein